MHVQEKIYPKAIVEDMKAWAKEGNPVADLFADFTPPFRMDPWPSGQRGPHVPNGPPA
jgi:hypothetical protein